MNKERINQVKMTKWIWMLSLMAILLLAGKGIKVEAATTTTLTPGVTKTDALTATETTKLYSFTVDKSGYFDVKFKRKDISESEARWTVTLMDTEMNQIDHVFIDDKDKSWTSAVYDFKKGTNLLIEVAASQYRIPECDGTEYELTVNTTEDSRWEQESNDTIKDATVIHNYKTESDAMIGTLWKWGDVDMYSYQVEEDGYFTINLQPEEPFGDDKHGYSIVLYDVNGKEIGKCYDIVSNYTSNKFNFKKGGQIYFAVKYPYSYQTMVGKKYTVKVNNTADSTWEVESLTTADSSWKDMVAEGNKLSETAVRGHLWCNEDQDLYRYDMVDDGELTVHFDIEDPTKISPNCGYKIYLYDAKGNQLQYKQNVIADYDIKATVKKGTYYVKIAVDWHIEEFLEYTITAKAKTKESSNQTKTTALTAAEIKQIEKTTPSIGNVTETKTNSKKRNVKIKWKKVKGADGYQIYRSTKKKKGYKCVQTITKGSTLSWKDTKVRNGKNYYYKMRAYKKNGKNNVYTKYSKVKKIKVKK